MAGDCLFRYYFQVGARFYCLQGCKPADHLTFSRKQYNPTHVEKNPAYIKNPAWPGSPGTACHRSLLHTARSFQAGGICAPDQPEEQRYLFLLPAPECHFPAFRAIAVHSHRRDRPCAHPLSDRHLDGYATPTELASDTPTITSTPVPGSVILAHVPFVDQMGRYNYCGPAT